MKAATRALAPGPVKIPAEALGQTATAALALHQVSYRYPDGTFALTGVNLRVKRGERRAVLGPNGAGKSTLSLLLNGLYRPYSGTVEVFGRPVGPAHPGSERWARRTVGLVFQDPDDQVFSPRQPRRGCYWGLYGRCSQEEGEQVDRLYPGGKRPSNSNQGEHGEQHERDTEELVPIKHFSFQKA